MSAGDVPRFRFGSHLRYREQVAQPGTDRAVRASGHKIVGVMRSDKLHRIYRVGMSTGGQRRLKDWKMI